MIRTRGFRIYAPLLVVAIIAGSAAGVTASEPVLRFRMGMAGASGSLPASMIDGFAREMGESSQQRFAVEPVMTSQAGAATQLYQDLVSGTLDMAIIESWALAINFPGLAVLTEPFLFSEPEVNRFIYGDGAEQAAEAMAPAGIRVLGWLTFPAPVVVSDRPLVAPEDFDRVKIGVTSSNPAVAAAFRSLGAVPMALDTPESGASTLAAGTIEAVEIAPYAITETLFPEEMDTVTRTLHYVPLYAVCMTNTAWGKIPEAARNDFLECAASALAAAGSASYAADDLSAERLSSGDFAVETADRDALRQAAGQQEAGGAASASPGNELLRTIEQTREPGQAW